MRSHVRLGLSGCRVASSARGGRRCAILLCTLACAAAGAAPIRAQTPVGAQPPGPQGSDSLGGGMPDWLRNALRLSGSASMTSEFYRAHGTDARRPGAAWRISLSPQASLFSGIGMGLDLLLSSEGSDVRQNINQLGLHPGWSWGQLHLGDFSETVSEYTMQGTRIRGAGVDLSPGLLRFSVQGGRAQRAIAAGLDAAVYRRTIVAGRLGIGHDDGSFIELQLLKAKDDPNSVESDLVVIDTLLVDTIPEALRPQYETTPQENLVGGIAGQLSLFRRALLVSAEGAAGLTSRDVRSREIDADSVDVPAFLAGVFPTRTSTHADYAYRVDGTLALRALSLRGGYEYLGAGYSSLGLAYLMNDRRSYQLGGALRLLENRVQLQAQYNHQNNNLLGQKLETTSRNTASVNLMTRWSSRVTTTIGVLQNVVANDAAIDTFLVDNRSRALTASVFVQQNLFGRPGVLSLAYAVHQMTDGNTVLPVPGVQMHNITTSMQVPLTEHVSVAPAVSAVLTQIEDGETQRNIYVGFRGNGRFLDGRLRASSNVSRTFSNGREIFGAMAGLSFPLPVGATLALQARHNRYSAFGLRPGFQESFAGVTLSRNFF